jgi:hypothetical protein
LLRARHASRSRLDNRNISSVPIITKRRIIIRPRISDLVYLSGIENDAA